MKLDRLNKHGSGAYFPAFLLFLYLTNKKQTDLKTLTNLLFILAFFSFLGCSNQSSDNLADDKSGSDTSAETINYIPGYIKLHKSGELKKRGEELWERMKMCDICPRNCKVNRFEGIRGQCGANSDLEIATYGPHFGEEYAFVGKGGTGRIFFTNCPMRCVFCLTHKISCEGSGEKYSIEDLAEMMLSIQQSGCSNICLVTPTHYIPHILLAIDIAAGKGLMLPIIYNTGGFENSEVLKYLDGVIDIYLTDFKYGCNEEAGKYSLGAFNYVDSTKKALIEMQRQVGTAKKDPKTGLWQKGLIIRHLIMPNNVSCSKEIIEWISKNLPKETYITIMITYEPLYNAKNYPAINRNITKKEYMDVINAAKDAGLTNVHVYD